MSDNSSQCWLDCLIITLLIFIPYSQVAGHKFIEFDDGAYLYENPHIIKGLTWESLIWAFSSITPNVGNWHPLTWISILMDRELFGPYPGGYLLMNVVYHTLASTLCYLAFRRVFDSRFTGFAIAIVFAIHPVNVENVAWFSERKSLIDAVFWFLGILAYWEWRTSKRPHTYGILIATHALGLMAKPMHVVFPCALWLIHLWYEMRLGKLRTWRWSDIAREFCQSTRWLWPLVLLSGIAIIITLEAQTYARYTSEAFPWGLRAANAFTSYGRYLRMFYMPGEYAPFYPIFFSEISWGRALPSIILLITVTSIALYFAKRHPAPLLGWLWFIGTMIPVIGFVHVGSQSHADRYLYIPMIGLGFIWSAIEDKLVQALRYWVLWPYLTLSSLSMLLLTHKQVSYWANGSLLFTHSIAITGDCMTSTSILINSYLRDQNLVAAIAYAREKIAISQNSANKVRLQFLLAKALRSYGLTNEALTELTNAINHGLEDRSADILQSDCYMNTGNIDAARESLKRALKRTPDPLTGEIVQEGERQWIENLERELANRKAAVTDEETVPDASLGTRPEGNRGNIRQTRAKN